jgi:hypothetical protein
LGRLRQVEPFSIEFSYTCLYLEAHCSRIYRRWAQQVRPSASRIGDVLRSSFRSAVALRRYSGFASPVSSLICITFRRLVSPSIGSASMSLLRHEPSELRVSRVSSALWVCCIPDESSSVSCSSSCYQASRSLRRYVFIVCVYPGPLSSRHQCVCFPVCVSCISDDIIFVIFVLSHCCLRQPRQRCRFISEKSWVRPGLPKE